MLCLKSLKKEERLRKRERFIKSPNRGASGDSGLAISANVLNANETGDVQADWRQLPVGMIHVFLLVCFRQITKNPN